MRTGNKTSFGKLLLLGLISTFVWDPLSSKASAPLPLEIQLKDSEAIIQGKYLSEVYKRAENDRTITVASFEIEKSVGLGYRAFINKNYFDVYFEGGTWGGETSVVPGTPKFIKGEQVILLLTKGPYGFTLSQNSQGKLRVSKSGGKTYVLSEQLPQDSEWSKVPMETFESLVFEIFGQSLQSVKALDGAKATVQVYRGKNEDEVGGLTKKSKRAIASQKEFKGPAIDPKPTREGLSIMVFVIVLGILGVVGKRTFGRD